MASMESDAVNEPEDQLLTESQQLDAQIAAARDEIAALQHRRSTLSAFLLSNPPQSLQTLLDPETTPADAGGSGSGASTLSAETLSTLRARHTAQRTTSLRALYRLCTSATRFETHDPDPAAVDGGRVLGVRIEVFSAQTRQFLVPYYLLLNRPWADDGESGAGKSSSGSGGKSRSKSRRTEALRLHRHTFPPFVPVAELCAKWLPPPPPELEAQVEDEDEDEDNDDGVLTRRQDLQALTRELRRHVVSYHRREDAIAKMGADNAEHVSRITLPDAENCEAKVYLKDGSMLGLRLDAKGRILKVAAKDQVGRRVYALERRVLRVGRVEGVRFGQ